MSEYFATVFAEVVKHPHSPGWIKASGDILEPVRTNWLARCYVGEKRRGALRTVSGSLFRGNVFHGEIG